MNNLIKDGTLHSAISLITRTGPKSEVTAIAVGVIANIAEKSKYKQLLVDLDIVPILVMVLLAGREDGKCSSALALCRLCSCSPDKRLDNPIHDVLIKAKGIPALARALEDKCPDVQDWAMSALFVLAQNKATIPTFLKSKILAPIVSIVDLDGVEMDSSVVVNAARVIRGIATDADGSMALVKAGAIEMLSTIMSVQSKCRGAFHAGKFHATLALKEMALQPGVRPTLVQSGAVLRGLVDYMTDSEPIEKAVAINAIKQISWSRELRQAIADAGAINSVAAFMKTNSDDVGKTDAILVINNMAKMEALRQAVMESGAVVLVVSMFRSVPLSEQTRLARVLTNLAETSATRHTLTRVGALKCLMEIQARLQHGSEGRKVVERGIALLSEL